jgi:ketosteroid isomerase-like protein
MKHRSKYFPVFSFVIIICTYPFQSFGQNTKDQSHLNPDSIAVVQTIHEFIEAFTNLNWHKFTDCFANDATAFFPPSAKFPSRANNKIEIENIFKNVFENARKLKSAPPYMVIQPKDLKIQMIGTVAIVTFVLNDPDLFGRRTIILKKNNGNWLIIHLHASGVVIPK